jgi:SPASM domain peptide maturase of grasp-with-spasm system
MNKMKIPNFFKLFAHCILVKGHTRVLICNIRNGYYIEIPNDLALLIDYATKFPLEKIAKKCSLDYNDELMPLFTQLTASQLGLFTDEPKRFPSMSMEWDAATKITNAIIDIEESSVYDFRNAIKQLNDLACFSIQIRSFEAMTLLKIEQIMEIVADSRVRTVDFMIPYNDTFSLDSLKKILAKHRRLISVTVHKSPNKKSNVFNERGIHFTDRAISSHLHCGIISEAYFAMNISTFTEAQRHNTCLNRKISIDTEGYIRNCPSMPEHYGNIKDTTLQEAMQHPDFKKYWFINKDQISVCKDCEFRYICTDCRAYRENPEDLYSKPLKCGYNPYTCEWEEWSTNPLKQKAIDYYGMREIIKN